MFQILNIFSFIHNMDNRGSEKQEVVNSSAADEKYAYDTSEKYLQDGKSVSSEEEKHSEENVITHGGDTALANAPWKYKMIALVTALMFPCKC